MACFRGIGSDRVGGSQRELKKKDKIIRRQPPESPPSENRGERGSLSRDSFLRETVRACPPGNRSYFFGLYSSDITLRTLFFKHGHLTLVVGVAATAAGSADHG